MISISDEAKKSYLSGQCKKALSLSFLTTGILLDEEDIYSESLVLEQGIFDGNDELCFGGCISTKMVIEVNLASGRIAKGEEVWLIMSLNDPDAHEPGIMQIFTGYLDSIETVSEDNRQKITCYDALYLWQTKNFYDTYASLPFPCTLADVRSALVTFMGLTENEVYDLMADDIQVDQQIVSGEINTLEALKQLCEINGVFGRINGAGYLEYVRPTVGSPYLPYPSNLLFPAADLYPGTESGNNTVYIDTYSQLVFEDYEVLPIDSVIIRDSPSDAQSGSYYESNANTLLIEGNMWMLGQYSNVKQAVAHTFYDELHYITYRPFTSRNRGVPWLECGDSIVQYAYDYSGGTPTTSIMVFMVLHRILKGIQWLEDEFSANGTEYQPEIKFLQASDNSELKAEVAVLNERVTEAEEDIGEKQNEVEFETVAPSQPGNEGDIRIAGRPVANNAEVGYGYDLFHYTDDDGWEYYSPVSFSTGDLTPLVDSLETGRVYLVYE